MEKEIESEGQGVKNWIMIGKSLKKWLSDKWKRIMEASVIEGDQSQPLSGFQKNKMARCYRNVKKAEAKKKEAWKMSLDLVKCQ